MTIDPQTQDSEFEELTAARDGAILLLGTVVDAVGRAESFDQLADLLEQVLSDDQDGLAMAREFQTLREADAISRKLVGYIDKSSMYGPVDQARDFRDRLVRKHEEIDQHRTGSGGEPT